MEEEDVRICQTCQLLFTCVAGWPYETCHKCVPCKNCNRETFRKDIRLTISSAKGEINVPWSCPCIKNNDSQEILDEVAELLVDNLKHFLSSEWYGLFYKWSYRLMNHEISPELRWELEHRTWPSWVRREINMLSQLIVEQQVKEESLDFALSQYEGCFYHHESDNLESPLSHFAPKPAKTS